MRAVVHHRDHVLREVRHLASVLEVLGTEVGDGRAVQPPVLAHLPEAQQKRLESQVSAEKDSDTDTELGMEGDTGGTHLTVSATCKFWSIIWKTMTGAALR